MERDGEGKEKDEVREKTGKEDELSDGKTI